eukprot:s720_g3.t1
MLKMITYNCKSLGHTNARLVEIAEDLHARGIHVAALQSTCWRRDQVRSEWTVKNRTGHPLFHCFSWGRSARIVQTGVLLLLSCNFFAKEHVTWRIDPDNAHNAGRVGGVRVVNRTSTHLNDHTFLVAYAPQETAADEDKHHFFTQVQQTIQTLPHRTTVWLLGDFNAHVGPDLRSRSVGDAQPEPSNDNGLFLSQACDACHLALANTFHPAGKTWWSPDGRTAHRLDYIALCTGFLQRIKHCRVNKVLGRRWQTSPVKDHWPVEVHVQLLSRWPAVRPRCSPFRWNRHALLRAGRDPQLFAPFLTEVSNILTQLDQVTWQDLQTRWTTSSARLLEVAQTHFGMSAAQTNPKLLPQTFGLLEKKEKP